MKEYEIFQKNAVTSLKTSTTDFFGFLGFSLNLTLQVPEKESVIYGLNLHNRVSYRVTAI